MRLLIINGPNLNMLGVREPDIYGRQTLADLEALVREHCGPLGVTPAFFQSNHEGALVDVIQQAYGQQDGLIINPAAYTHTSVAIFDALKAVGLPAVEVHLSDPTVREPFRHHSYITPACIAAIRGKGFAGYLEAVDLLVRHIRGQA